MSGKKGYNEYWGHLLNKNTRKWLIKQIPQDFYKQFYVWLQQNYSFFSPTDIYNIEGTGLWGSTIRNICAANPEWEWIHHIQVALNWIDYDNMNADISEHILRLIKKGKL